MYVLRPQLKEFADQIDERRWASREVLLELQNQVRGHALQGSALRAQLARRLTGHGREMSAWLSALDTLDDNGPDPLSANLGARDAIKSIVEPGESTVTKRALRNALRVTLQTSTPNIDALLLAGLSFLLVKYNPALGASYYHHIMSELVPTPILTEIIITVAIPPWQGTSGWVLERARILAEKWPGFRSSPQPVALYSAMADLRGRNTVNRYVLGSRSWLGVPVFGAGAHPVGIVIVTFPLDGLFYDTGMEVSPFVQTFLQLVSTMRAELVRALRTDEHAAVFPMGPRPSIRAWERDRVGEQGRRLLPDFPTPDDPIGLLAVVQGNQRGIAPPDVQVQIRRRSFIDPLYQLVELASSFPEDASPAVARALDMLAKRPSPDALAWHLQDHGDDRLIDFYPDDAREISFRVHEVWRSLTPLRECAPLEPLRIALRRGLKLATGPLDRRDVVDLVLPLVGQQDRVQGYLRFNCTRHPHASEIFVRTYTIIREASKSLRAALAALLAELVTRVRDARRTLPRLKLLTSLRASLCEAIAWKIARAFYPDDHREPELRGLALFQAAARSLEEVLPLEATLRALDDFCRKLVARRDELANVILISFWLHAERPVVISVHEEPEGLAELFMADRSLVRMLHTLVEHQFGAKHDRFEHHDTYWHRRDGKEGYVVIPPAYRSGAVRGEELHLSLELRNRGDRVETILRAADIWYAKLTWALRRYPRPMAYQAIPRGITHNLFGDVRAVPMRVRVEDLDVDAPEKLLTAPSHQDTILSRAKDLMDFVGVAQTAQTLRWRARRLEPRRRSAAARAWLWVVDRDNASPQQRERALHAAVDAWRTDGEVIERAERRRSRHGMADRSILRIYFDQRVKDDASVVPALGAFKRLDTLIAIDADEDLWISQKLSELLLEMKIWYHSRVDLSGTGEWLFDESTHRDAVILFDNLLSNATRYGAVEVKYLVSTSSALIQVRNSTEMPAAARRYLNRETDYPPQANDSGIQSRQGLGIIREVVDRLGWGIEALYDGIATTITITIGKV